jgi:predicted nucleotidyltransferase
MIPEITERIVRAFHPEQIILFGSHARGDARPDSDVDVLVVLAAILDKHRTTVELQRLFTDLTVGVDVIVASPDELRARKDDIASVLRPALEEGKVLYAA